MLACACYSSEGEEKYLTALRPTRVLFWSSQVPGLKPSDDQLDTAIGTTYDGLRGYRNYGNATAAWNMLDGNAALKYSCISVLTAQQLYAQLQVPIGMIQVSKRENSKGKHEQNIPKNAKFFDMPDGNGAVKHSCISVLTALQLYAQLQVPIGMFQVRRLPDTSLQKLLAACRAFQHNKTFADAASDVI